MTKNYCNRIYWSWTCLASVLLCICKLNLTAEFPQSEKQWIFSNHTDLLPYCQQRARVLLFFLVWHCRRQRQPTSDVTIVTVASSRFWSQIDRLRSSMRRSVHEHVSNTRSVTRTTGDQQVSWGRPATVVLQVGTWEAVSWWRLTTTQQGISLRHLAGHSPLMTLTTEVCWC